MNRRPPLKPVRMEKNELCVVIARLLLVEDSLRLNSGVPADLSKRLRSAQRFGRDDETIAFRAIVDILPGDTTRALTICRVLIGDITVRQLVSLMSTTLNARQRKAYAPEVTSNVLAKVIIKTLATHEWIKGNAKIIKVLNNLYLLPLKDVINLALYITNITSKEI